MIRVRDEVVLEIRFYRFHLFHGICCFLEQCSTEFVAFWSSALWNYNDNFIYFKAVVLIRSKFSFPRRASILSFLFPIFGLFGQTPLSSTQNTVKVLTLGSQSHTEKSFRRLKIMVILDGALEQQNRSTNLIIYRSCEIMCSSWGDRSVLGYNWT